MKYVSVADSLFLCVTVTLVGRPVSGYTSKSRFNTDFLANKGKTGWHPLARAEFSLEAVSNSWRENDYYLVGIQRNQTQNVKEQGSGKALYYTVGSLSRPLAGAGGWIVLICTCICTLVFSLQCFHEGFVLAGGRSATDYICGQTGIQATYLVWSMLIMMDPTVLIPTSYELIKEMGGSAAMSGLLVGSGYLVSSIGSIGAAYLCKNYSQRFVRVVGLIGCFMLAMQNLIYAVVLDSQDTHDIRTAWFIIVLRMFGGIGKISYVCQFMAYTVTPRPSRTAIAILTAFAANAGLCLGPFVTACVLQAVGGREGVPSVYTRSAAPVYIMGTLWCMLGLMFAIFVPPDLAYLPDCGKLDDVSPRSGQLTMQEREHAVRHGLLYTAERGLGVAAIEAGIAMILEVQFGWSTRAIGFAISAVFGVTMIVCAVLMFVKYIGMLKDVQGLVITSFVSACGAILLLDWPDGTAWLVLIAALMVYPFMYAANGILDGIVTCLTIPNTWHSLESYLGARGALQALFRFLGYPLARFLIDCCGRNSYATGLMVLGGAGCYSANALYRMLGSKGQSCYLEYDSEVSR